MFRTEESYQHKNYKMSKLSNDKKLEIDRLFELKIKPKAILEKLRANDIYVKNKSQISNYLSYLKKKNTDQIKSVSVKLNSGVLIIAWGRMMMIRLSLQTFHSTMEMKMN